MLDGERGESTASVAERVERARTLALERAGRLNAALDDVLLHEHAPLTGDAERLLRAELERGRLSARGYHRIRRVARTLSDLAGAVDGPIDADHVAAALVMRTAIGPNSIGAAA